MMQRHNGIEFDHNGAFVYYGHAVRDIEALNAEVERLKRELHIIPHLRGRVDKADVEIDRLKEENHSLQQDQQNYLESLLENMNLADQLAEAKAEIERLELNMCSGLINSHSDCCAARLRRVIRDRDAEIERLRNLVLKGAEVVQDFMPNIGRCALQDYERLNTFIVEAEALKEPPK